MLSLRLLSLLVCGLSCFSVKCLGQTAEYLPLVESPRLGLRHTEGTGLGYSVGYTSLNLFLTKSLATQNLVSFTDVRGHLFNNGMQAANVNLGVRHLQDSYNQIWGINIAYDYFQNTRHSYNQVGAGFEVLGENWDFCLNAYIPIGNKKINIYRFSYAFYEELKQDNPSNFKFGLRAKEQFALNGVDTLFGYRFSNLFRTNLCVRAGPYYYWGYSVKTKNAFASKYEATLGGRFTVDVLINKYLSLSGMATYDSIFKWRNQGTIALNIPFDLIFRKCRNECTPCSLTNRFYERVKRNEIITIDHATRRTNNPNVLDPEFVPNP